MAARSPSQKTSLGTDCEGSGLNRLSRNFLLCGSLNSHGAESEKGQGADSRLREGDFHSRRTLWIRSSPLVLSSHPRQYLCSLPASCMLCQINRAGYESLACVCRHETQHCILVFALCGAFMQHARKVLALLELSVQTVSLQVVLQ